MLRLHNITLYRGSRLLIENADAFIQPQQKVGLIGHNGSGKTSLFAAILGQLELGDGSIQRPAQLRIAHIEQTIPSLEESATHYVLRAHPVCHRIYTELLAAEQTQQPEELAILHAELADIEGYAYKANAEKILAGLGFTQQQLKQPVAEFSGGWRMRLHLARCLLAPADLLLLDEPTNHLDLPGILWLQQWLQHYPNTLLLITHDRDFLDQVTTHILHLHQHQLKLYTGNYSQFTEQRAQAIALQNAQYCKQQQQIKHMLSYVERFRYKASKAKQAQSRLKAIDRLEKIAPILLEHTKQLQFKQPEQLSNPLINLHQVALGYGTTPLLTQVNLSVETQSRIGLIGANGAGKSTLLKGLIGELLPLSGELTRHQKLHIGYFAQHQIEAFLPEHTCLQVMQMAAPQMPETALRSYLGLFQFSGERALQPTGQLSGGERARLALAKIIWQRPHLLLLDEPTNHLDLDMRDALNIALQNYHGAVVLVSHDRFLLRSVVDELWLVHQGQVKVFTGDLEDYSQWLLAESATLPRVLTKASKAALLQIKQSLIKLEKQIAKLTHELENTEDQMIELSQELHVSENQQKLVQLEKTRKQITTQIQQHEAEWYTLQEQQENDSGSS